MFCQVGIFINQDHRWRISEATGYGSAFGDFGDVIICIIQNGSIAYKMHIISDYGSKMSNILDVAQFMTLRKLIVFTLFVRWPVCLRKAITRRIFPIPFRWLLFQTRLR